MTTCETNSERLFCNFSGLGYLVISNFFWRHNAHFFVIFELGVSLFATDPFKTGSLYLPPHFPNIFRKFDFVSTMLTFEQRFMVVATFLEISLCCYKVNFIWVSICWFNTFFCIWCLFSNTYHLMGISFWPATGCRVFRFLVKGWFIIEWMMLVIFMVQE